MLRKHINWQKKGGNFCVFMCVCTRKDMFLISLCCYQIKIFIRQRQRLRGYIYKFWCVCFNSTSIKTFLGLNIKIHEKWRLKIYKR